jgi:hypothetical protein
VNHLKNGTIQAGCEGSSARLVAELEDACKGSSSPDFWNAYEALVDRHKEEFGVNAVKARAMVDLFLEPQGWVALP